MAGQPRLGSAAIAAALVAIAAGSSAVAAAITVGRGTRHARARVAQALKATDTAHLHYLSASGSLLFEEGRASGTLPGRMRVHFSVGASMSGSFTIYAGGGAISGHGTARLHGSGVYESFAGSLVVSGGGGRYAHARGRARLYGTFNRDSYALLVQTVGTLYF